MLIMLNYKKII